MIGRTARLYLIKWAGLPNTTTWMTSSDIHHLPKTALNDVPSYSDYVTQTMASKKAELLLAEPSLSEGVTALTPPTESPIPIFPLIIDQSTTLRSFLASESDQHLDNTLPFVSLAELSAQVRFDSAVRLDLFSYSYNLIPVSMR